MEAHQKLMNQRVVMLSPCRAFSLMQSPTQRILPRSCPRLRALSRLPDDFVIHSLQHTMLTRLGKAGGGVFTIIRVAGHSSITVSQRYVHPSPEALERAFERLETLNGRVAKALPEGSEIQRVPTIPPTSTELPQRMVS